MCHNDKNRIQRWKKQRKKYGFDDRETWALNSTFVEWLYSHLKMYLKIGGKIVNLDFHKLEFEGKEYTQKEAIKKILKACKYYFRINGYIKDIPSDIEKENKADENMQEAIRLFAALFPAMWW